MNAKDAVSLVFSATALTISAVNFYLTNYRVHHEVLARVSDIAVAGDSVHAHVVFVNSGNRQAIVSAARFELAGQAGVPRGGQLAFRATTADGSLPFVISPRELQVIVLTLPFSAFSESGLTYAGLRFRALDASGEAFDTWSGMQIHARVDEEGRLEQVGPVEGAPTYTSLLR